MARRIASDLDVRLKGTIASSERTAASKSGGKQLDVNYSTARLGLGLGISLKSVHIRDVGGSKRYTHNMKRNEEELRVEATGYHKRQPYSVMVAVLFLPFDAAEDGKRGNPSSFGSWVRHLRPYSGRMSPEDEDDKFEKIFIALYDPSGVDLRFFDVEQAPPKNGRPEHVLDYEAFLDNIYHAFLRRNQAEFQWAEGEEEPLDIEDFERHEEGEKEA
jgi:hypothetical protein